MENFTMEGNMTSLEEVENMFAEEDPQPPENPDPENPDNNDAEGDEFQQSLLESVGKKKEGVEQKETVKGKEGTSSEQGKGTSPKTNNYSSIANALRENGTFPDLTDEDIETITDGETLLAAINKQAVAVMDEKQKRVNDALDAGIDVPVIKQYEQTIDYLDSIEEDKLSEETDEATTLRKQLIYQDFVNRGYSPERAQKEVKKSFDAGTEIEDAKDALQSNKEFYNNGYKSLIEEQKRKQTEYQEGIKAQTESLKKSILEDEKGFGSFEVDQNTRKKVVDAVTRPISKNKNGQYVTAVQKYAEDNPVDFQKYIGLFYTLTGGFKDFDSLFKGNFKKEKKKAIQQLENVINGTQRTAGGELNFLGDLNDPNQRFTTLAGKLTFVD